MKMMLTMITATIIPGGFLILAVVALAHILRHSSGNSTRRLSLISMLPRIPRCTLVGLASRTKPAVF
jgi:hypothetical protein